MQTKHTQEQADRLRADAERLEQRAMHLPIEQGGWMFDQASRWRKQAQEIEKHLPEDVCA